MSGFTGPEVITYRYSGAMVYVTPSATFQEAVDTACSVFPELKQVDPDRIAISVHGSVNKKRQLIRIGPMAWPSIIASRARYEVLDITLEPDIIVTDVDADSDALPRYTINDSEKHSFIDYFDPSRAPSPSDDSRVLHKNIPGVTARSRRTDRSPSPTLSAASHEPACAPVGWAKSLFGKRVR
ncbi:hypothetical protein BV20DRAFT_974785 [Pilatotrama ljubarskyi]|nr:hypothetical protein BV20DRAFT_974785 [Pilatotrama ljubarskyi]